MTLVRGGDSVGTAAATGCSGSLTAVAPYATASRSLAVSMSAVQGPCGPPGSAGGPGQRGCHGSVPTEPLLGRYTTDRQGRGLSGQSRLIGWPGGRVAGWPKGRVAGWPKGRVAVWPKGRVAGWPKRRVAGWSGVMRSTPQTPTPVRPVGYGHTVAGRRMIQAAKSRKGYQAPCCWTGVVMYDRGTGAEDEGSVAE